MVLKKRLCMLAAALTLAAGSSAFADDHILVVADEWPPFSGENLPGRGVSIDITQAVLTRAGYVVETAILPWSRVVNGARTGEYDVVTSLFLDSEMQEVLDYSEPFFATQVQFVQQKGREIVFDGLESLRPYTIAVGTGFLYEPAFDAAEDLDKFEVITTLQGVQMVAAGRVDLTLDSTHVVRHSILLTDPDLLDQVEFLSPPLAEQQIHMAVSRKRSDHRQIVSAFNAALAEMRADGSLLELLEKHNLD